MDAPVLDLREGGAEVQQLVLDQERHDLGQLDVGLLAVGEAGHGPAVHQRLAGRVLHVTQGAGRMAHHRHGLAGGEERLDQPRGTGVFGQVPHRAVPARIEDGVEAVLFHAVEAHGAVEPALGLSVLLEPAGDVGLEIGVLALGIERRAPALGRGQGDVRAGVFELIVGRRHLLQPEAGLAAGVAELVVGGQDHQHVHRQLLARSRTPRRRGL